MPDDNRSSLRIRFTIANLFALTVVAAVLATSLLPWMADARERARQSTCSGRMRQLGLSIHNYHSAFKHLPSAMDGDHTNAGRISGLVTLLPFMEQQVLYERIMLGQHSSLPSVVPWDKTFTHWQSELDTLRCPGDSAHGDHFAMVNFAFCIGDSVHNIHNKKSNDEARGMFAPHCNLRFRDTLDGISNTILMCEIANAHGRDIRGQFATNMPNSIADAPSECLNTIDLARSTQYRKSLRLSKLGRGGNWADGAGGHSLVQTILPPNSPSCAIGGELEVDGMFSGGSRHKGGCHVMMGDGAIIYISDSIDAGDSSDPSPPSHVGVERKTKVSPYGLWGNLGTRAGNEHIEERLNQ